jgi:hypothetical protein
MILNDKSVRRDVRQVIVSILLIGFISSSPVSADRYGIDEQRQEEDVAKCLADPQCASYVRREEVREAEEQRQHQERDGALRVSDPVAYWTMRLSRIALAIIVVACIIGAYSFLFGLGGKKK